MSNLSRFDSAIHFLRYCQQTKNISTIKNLHCHLLRSGVLFMSHDFHTELIVTYTHCLPRNDRKTITNCFKCMNLANPLHYNVIISGFCRKGFPFLALRTFSFMHVNGVPMDTYTLCSSLTASTKIKDVQFGIQIHALVEKSGWSSSVFVGSALIGLYSKLCSIKDAELMFDEMPMKNTVCANALLSGYCEAELWVQELELIRKMPSLKLKHDEFSLSAALCACTGLSAIETGRQLHNYSLRTACDIESDVFLQSALIEMYGKCGLVKKASQVFKLAGIEVKGERSRDVVLWTSMLGVYARNGYHKEVISLYKEMLVEGIRPDDIAFLTVISACSRTGQVQLGIKYFESMSNDFKLHPGAEHYSCLVDLLCKAGELQKAWEILNDTNYDRIASGIIPMLGAIVSACLDSGNIELGKLAAKRALELDPKHVGIFIMLSNLYARFGMWDEIKHLRMLMKERGLKKDVGCSWIQVTN